MDRVRKLLHLAVVYLERNPGAVTMLAGYAVLALAKLGLHVTEAELYAIIAALLPVIAGGHVAARKSRARRAGEHEKA